MQWLCDQTDTMLRAGKKGFLGLRTAPQTSPKLIHFPDLLIVVLHSITCYYLLTYLLTYMLVCTSRILNNKEQLGGVTSFLRNRNMINML